MVGVGVFLVEGVGDELVGVDGGWVDFWGYGGYVLGLGKDKFVYVVVEGVVEVVVEGVEVDEVFGVEVFVDFDEEFGGCVEGW